VTILPGLCSVTFRQLSAAEVIALAAGCGLTAIEWGADVHVPPGDLTAASDVARRSADAGLTAVSYGSYLFAGQSPDGDGDAVWDTAVAVGAVNVRVWCGYGTGPDASADERQPICGQLVRWAHAAAERELTVSLEFHPATLTETAASTSRVLNDVGAPNLYTYWQPAPGAASDHALAELDGVTPDLSHLHVFWWETPEDRRALAEGEALWPAALAHVAAASGAAARRWTSPTAALLEFVRDDNPRHLPDDAATLRRWLDRLA